MKASGNCISLIKHFESCKLKSYLDTGGVLTIGWGHTGPDVRVDQEISQVRADALLMLDVYNSNNIIALYASGVPLNQNQYDALVSFVFNVGVSNFRASTLLRKLLKRDYKGAADEFPKWIWDNGRVLRGLERRRKAEQLIFLTVWSEREVS